MASLVLPGGAIDRRHYELCRLSELRGRLQAGDIWFSGSRRHRSLQERLISEDTLDEMQQAGTLPIAVEPDFEQLIAGRRTLLDARLVVVDARAKDGLLPDVSILRGVLKIAPIEKSTPPEAEALAARLYAMLPRIRIADLMAEVAGWTLFPDCFTHLQTGIAAADTRTLLAGLLADGLNLGLTHMAEACSVACLAQLAWTWDWHIRDETYARAPGRLVNQQQREPFAGQVRQRRRFVVRRAVLPDGRLWPGRQPPQRSLWPEARLQGLHPPVGPLRAVLHQTSCWVSSSRRASPTSSTAGSIASANRPSIRHLNP